jgi:single-strand DNA-binding protein
MANFNKVILVGNVTRDPELRYTPKGVAIAKIGLAVNRTWRTDTGESREEVTFIDIDAFGKQAETLGQYIKKGSPLLVEGRLKLDQWDDKQTGQKRSKLGVIVEGFQFLGGPRSEGSPVDAPRRTASTSAAGGTAAAGSVNAAAETDGPPPEEDDVPF